MLSRADLARHRIQLPDGPELQLVERGGSGPILVFLHGYTDSWRSFELLFDHLDPAFRLIALDQRGHGGSAKAASYRIADFAGDAIGVIEEHAGRPVHLVGHSLGSIVAQRVAEARPDLLETLILIGAARTARAHPALRALREAIAALGETVPRDFIAQFQASTTHRPLEDAQLAVFVGESARLDLETWLGALDGQLDEPPDHPALPTDLPVLSLSGREDTVFDQAAQSALAQAAARYSARAYDDIGHAPHWENPAEVGQDMTRFVLTHHRAAAAE